MSILDEIAKITPFHRLYWEYEQEPTDRPKGGYYLDYMPITGVPFWAESDEQYRERLNEIIKNKKTND